MEAGYSQYLLRTGELPGGKKAKEIKRPDIRILEVRSDVLHRYARTEVYSVVVNPADESQEVSFSAVLPDEAFISSFAITVGGRVYPARVEGREEARQEYQSAVRAGRTAANVEVSARNANLFTVELNVAANDKAAFNLTYEQLLSREQGSYRLRIMLDPGQVVQRLLVEARIRDSAILTLVRVANLRAADNEVDYATQEPDDPLATVKRLGPGEALVQWEPDEEAQRRLAAGDGLKGLLEMQYDVDHSAASKLLVGDGGYFVHFFSPPDDELPILAKHVVFLLDVSGSMNGRKIEQVREAMVAILAELRQNDVFSLLTFSTETSVWVPGRGFRRTGGEVRNTVVSASSDMIAQAQEAVRQLRDQAATHMYGALKAAYRAVREGREQVTGVEERQSLIILLTDGHPNGPYCWHGELVAAVATATADPSTYAPLYSLAFGDDADFDLLKKLSLRGKGFARKIYEAADAALQLRNFYRRVASPLLANVTFQYADDQVELPSLTQSAFPVFLAGTELAVAGHLPYGADEAAQTDWSRLRATVRGASAGQTAVETPTAVQRLEPQQSTFVERLWAYLTVRQLLERANGDDADARERARQLALRYAFVTSLTSLVVVKPDDQTSTAGLRDAAQVRGFSGSRDLSAVQFACYGALRDLKPKKKMCRSRFRKGRQTVSPDRDRDRNRNRDRDRERCSSSIVFGRKSNPKPKRRDRSCSGRKSRSISRSSSCSRSRSRSRSYSSRSRSSSRSRNFSHEVLKPATSLTYSADSVYDLSKEEVRAQNILPPHSAVAPNEILPSLASSTAAIQVQPCKLKEQMPVRADIRILEVRSDVLHRYARTEVYSVVVNPADESQEVIFSAVLPDEAFISSFAITVGGVVYPMSVEGCEEKRVEYAAGAFLQLSARNANLFTVVLNMAARDKAALNFTYEQLLVRKQGRYRLCIMLDPGQVVPKLLVEARIRDSDNLMLVRVASLWASDDEVDDDSDDPLATVERLAPEEALVQWEPDEEAQRRLATGDGLKGLLEVQYDVDHSGASTVLVGGGGYFVNYFAPPDGELLPLAKHVVFLLDVSASMAGRKMEQLKEAMSVILMELQDFDVFSLFTFSSETSVWVPGHGFRPAGENVRNTVVSASSDMVLEAQEAVSQLTAQSSTQLLSALRGAYRAVREGQEKAMCGREKEPIIFLLLGSQPKGPHGKLEDAVSAATSGTSTYAPLYSLAFGDGADFDLLKKLSLRGKGFARKIYEAADAVLQLRNFYRRVASPLLANVVFQYADRELVTSSLSQSTFPVLLAGTEVTVAGHFSADSGISQTKQADWFVVTATIRGDSGGHKPLERKGTVQYLPPQQSSILERIWAYLTVRQLLERANGGEAEAGESARQLGLRYSFVTPNIGTQFQCIKNKLYSHYKNI